MRTILAIALFAITLAGCAREPAAESAVDGDRNPNVIVTYEVPDGTAREVESVINSLLAPGGDGDRIGRARVLPNGLIVVSAPVAVQPGIEEFIDELRSRPAGEEQRIRLHYWLLRGTPTGAGQVAADLRDIEAPLLDLASAAGPMRFERLDYAQQVMTSGGRAGVEGGVFNGNAEAAARGPRIALDLHLNAPSLRSHVRTQMDLKDGETVVLAQMGDGRAEGAEPGAVHVYVVRAETF